MQIVKYVGPYPCSLIDISPIMFTRILLFINFWKSYIPLYNRLISEIDRTIYL